MPNNNNIVDAGVDRRAGAAAPANQSERFDRGMAIAAILQSIPLFVWAAPLVLLFGFILMALWYNRSGHNLEDFTSNALMWASRLLIGLGILMLAAAAWKVYRMYHQFIIDAAARRVASAGVQKALAGARNAELKNDQLQAKIDLEKQLPYILKWAVEQGYPVEYGKDGLKIAHQVGGGVRVTELGAAAQLGPGSSGAAGAIAGPAGGELPTNVLYQDIRGQVPQGHILVGIGRGGVVETKDKAVGACVWIVGMSGTGKTSTTVLRVEERVSMGHGLLGVDPHFHKDDSLYHAIYETNDGQPGPYKKAFVKPMACQPAQQKEVLQYFLDEFNGRKGGRIPKSQWKPLTLLVDEVGALMDPTTEEEEEIAKMLPTIARICGQEARNFFMGGVFISQQATGLAWLRKMALMIIVHQLLMESEKKLAVNNDMAVVKAMELWPIGRTYIYGVGFQEGPRTVQQPYFRPVIVDGDGYALDDDAPETGPAADAPGPGQEEPGQEKQGSAPVPALSGDLRRVFDAVHQLQALGQTVQARSVGEVTGFGKDKANQLLNKLADLGYIERPGRKAV